MKTLLKYAMGKLLGPPTRVMGEDLWACHRCGSLKRHARPHKPPHKDTFGCWTCDDFGDVYDVLREAGVPWPDRHARAAELATEYQRLGLGHVGPDPRFSTPAPAADANGLAVAGLIGQIWGLTMLAEGRSPEYMAEAFASLAGCGNDDDGFAGYDPGGDDDDDEETPAEAERRRADTARRRAEMSAANRAAIRRFFKKVAAGTEK